MLLLLLPFPHRMSLAPLIYNRLSIGFISRGYVLGLYLAEKGTRLSGIFDYPESAKSHDSRVIGTCLYYSERLPYSFKREVCVVKVTLKRWIPFIITVWNKEETTDYWIIIMGHFGSLIGLFHYFQIILVCKTTCTVYILHCLTIIIFQQIKSVSSNYY